jgi:lipopolysaccharide assembly outer membrane protein LptD (OstA)
MLIILSLIPVVSAQQDSISLDSLAYDSTAATKQDTVNYSANVVQYSVSDSTLCLYGEAVLESEGIRLVSDTIKYHAGRKTLEAWGHPILYSDGNTVSGEKMYYYMNEKRGKVDYGSARSEGKLYNGNLIAKMADASYLVKSGDYSTCDRDTNPHYYFWGEKMKILPGDKAIVKPFVLNIADVPVAILPYFIVPINRNRRSGFLTPRWGQITDQGSQGGYINDIGYYWAINDYTDLEARANFTNGEGFFFQNVRFNALFNYALRYTLNGSLDADYDILQGSEGNRYSWGLRYRHTQNIQPDGSFTLRGSGDLTGDKNFYKRSTDRRTDFLKQRLNSDLALSKSFKKQGITISASASYRQDLETEENFTTLPSINFNSASRSLPFLGVDPDSQISADSLPWYKKLTWSYSATGINRSQLERKRKYDYLDPTYDTSNTVMVKSGGKDINHNLSFGLPRFPKLGPINITPSLGMSSSWFFQSRRRGYVYQYDTITYSNRTAVDTIYEWDTLSTFKHVDDFGVGTSFSTQIYGRAKIGFFGISSFLHNISPSVGWSYAPEIKNSDNLLGSNGIVNRNRDEQQRINMGLQNIFQLKMDPDKSGKSSGNITLLNVGASTGYNFMAKNRAGVVTGKWAPLSVGASTEQYGISISYNSVYDFYDSDESLLKTFPRMLNSGFNASTGLRISGKFIGGDVLVERDNTMANVNNTVKSALKTWSLNAQISANHSKYWDETFDVFTKSTSFSLSNQATLQFTENWSLAYNNRFDFETNKLVDQSMNLRRDFHCWEALFDWIISGYRQGYYFRIGIKDIPDIKFEKRKGPF